MFTQDTNNNLNDLNVVLLNPSPTNL